MEVAFTLYLVLTKARLIQTDFMPAPLTVMFGARQMAALLGIRYMPRFQTDM
jgi:hypothetical protein